MSSDKYLGQGPYKQAEPNEICYPDPGQQSVPRNFAVEDIRSEIYLERNYNYEAMFGHSPEEAERYYAGLGSHIHNYYATPIPSQHDSQFLKHLGTFILGVFVGIMLFWLAMAPAKGAEKLTPQQKKELLLKKNAAKKGKVEERPYKDDLSFNRPPQVGDKGKLSDEGFFVLQVLNETSVLADISFYAIGLDEDKLATYVSRSVPVIIEGIPTKGYVDKRRYETSQQFEVTGTAKLFDLQGGPKTMLQIKPVEKK
jgi:hypothetical protein